MELIFRIFNEKKRMKSSLEFRKADERYICISILSTSYISKSRFIANSILKLYLSKAIHPQSACEKIQSILKELRAIVLRL